MSEFLSLMASYLKGSMTSGAKALTQTKGTGTTHKMDPTYEDIMSNGPKYDQVSLNFFWVALQQARTNTVGRETHGVF